MMRGRMLFVLCGAAFPASGIAATVPNLSFRLPPKTFPTHVTDQAPVDRRDIIDGELWMPGTARPDYRDDLVTAASDATSRAVAIGTPRGIPFKLDLDAVAGHRSFATMTARRNALGWRVTNGGGDLGVGTTAAYGFRLARALRFTPFVALDYNRVDSARRVDITGPNPFINDSAGLGFTGTAGATLSHRFGAERRFRVVAFGAAVAANADQTVVREFGSIGARVINAVGNSALNSLWEEVGVGLDYRLNARARVNSGVVQSMDQSGGDRTAAKVGLRVAL